MKVTGVLFCAISAMPPRSKARRAKADNLEIFRRKKRLKDNEGRSLEVRAERLEGKVSCYV